MMNLVLNCQCFQARINSLTNIYIIKTKIVRQFQILIICLKLVFDCEIFRIDLLIQK